MKHYRKRMNFCMAVLDLKWKIFSFYNDDASFEEFFKTEVAQKWAAYYNFYVLEILMKGEPSNNKGIIGVSPLQAKDYELTK